MNPWVARGLTLVMVVLALLGLAILCTSVPENLTWYVVVGVVAFAVVASVPWLRSHLLAFVCAAVLALLALLPLAVGVRVLLDVLSIEGGLPIPLGLVVASVLFVAVALWYLVGDWDGTTEQPDGPAEHRWQIPSPGWPLPWAIGAAVVLAGLVIFLPPLVIGGGEQQKVAKSQRAVSELDVMIVSERPRPRARR